MSTVIHVVPWLIWLFGAWAFGAWGVERLPMSRLVRVMTLNERWWWLRTHPAQAAVMGGLKALQLLFLVWQVRTVAHVYHWLQVPLQVHAVLAALVVMTGTRRWVPETLNINIGGQIATGRWVATWQDGSEFRGLILRNDGSTSMGLLPQRSLASGSEGHRTIGLVPQQVCYVVWGVNIALALLTALTLW